MNCLLGETSIDMQVDYFSTRLTGEVQEWFYRNVEQYDRQVCEDLGNGSAGTIKEVPAYLDTPPCVK